MSAADRWLTVQLWVDAMRKIPKRQGLPTEKYVAEFERLNHLKSTKGSADEREDGSAVRADR